LYREFVPLWGNRPITDLKREDVAAEIREIVKRGHIAQSHNGFSALRRIFNWCVGTSEFGLEVSPMAALRPQDLIGRARGQRDRVLSDDELRAVWLASDQPGYP
jgi:integrase